MYIYMYVYISMCIYIDICIHKYIEISSRPAGMPPDPSDPTPAFAHTWVRVRVWGRVLGQPPWTLE